MKSWDREIVGASVVIVVGERRKGSLAGKKGAVADLGLDYT